MGVVLFSEKYNFSPLWGILLCPWVSLFGSTLLLACRLPPPAGRRFSNRCQLCPSVSLFPRNRPRTTGFLCTPPDFFTRGRRCILWHRPCRPSQGTTLSHLGAVERLPRSLGPLRLGTREFLTRPSSLRRSPVAFLVQDREVLPWIQSAFSETRIFGTAPALHMAWLFNSLGIFFLGPQIIAYPMTAESRAALHLVTPGSFNGSTHPLSVPSRTIFYPAFAAPAAFDYWRLFRPVLLRVSFFSCLFCALHGGWCLRAMVGP